MTNTDFFDAIRTGDTELVTQLLSSDSNLVHLQTDWGCYPLHIAADASQVEIMKLLIAQGADVNAQNDDGETPLFWDIESTNYKNVVQLLLEHGADINATNKFGRTILHELAMYGTDEEHYSYLVNLGANIHQKDNLGETPLHFAALSGSASDVRFLIDNGADVNAHDNQGNTPLHLVVDANFMLTAINYYLETIEELIRLGADVSAKTNDGQTPLDLTRRYDKVRRDPIANLLIAHGAK